MISPKNYFLFRALVFTACAIFAPISMIHPKQLSQEGIGPVVAVGGMLLALAIYYWIKFIKTPGPSEFYDIRKRPPAEQLKVSMWALWLFAIVGPILSYQTYLSLVSLQQGNAKSVSLMAPAGLIYRHFGFWPAALCWPVLFLSLIGVCILRMRKAKLLLASHDAAAIR